MKSISSKILQNARKPKGFIGRLMLKGMNIGHASLSNWALSLINWQPQWQVLDIGCGGGANIAEMLKRSPRGEVYGIDFSAESVAYAQKTNRKALGKRCFIEQGNVESLPYNDNKFDLVTAFETVYFWKDMPKALQEVRRVLKTNGLFLICCEVSNPANTKWSDLIEGMVIHSENELQTLLEQNGFSNISVSKQPTEKLSIVAQAINSNTKKGNKK